jgi:SAM-dependent methyltransferase
METLNTQGVQKKYNSEDRTTYEEGRWASSPVAKAGFTLTKEAIESFLFPYLVSVHEYLELGPGPGTWTKVIREKITGAQLHLVDISREMLASAKKNLGEGEHITFTESDFLLWRPQKTYDVFFSSRAIEYFPDKRPAPKNIAEALRSGGHAFLITKHPHYTRMRMLGKKAGAFHEGQITPRDFSSLAQECSLRTVSVHPVFVVVPFFRSAILNLLVTRIARRFPWNPLTASISESYLIHLQKV